MKKIKSVCVYCASSSKINPRYFEAARETGRLLAQNGMRCVCGAGNQGLMGTLADSVLENGGEVLGVIPRFMIDEGWCHKGLTETIVTADMHERKERMAQESEQRKNDLVVYLAHDLKTPLTSVIAYLSMLGKTGYAAGRTQKIYPYRTHQGDPSK